MILYNDSKRYKLDGCIVVWLEEEIPEIRVVRGQVLFVYPSDGLTGRGPLGDKGPPGTGNTTSSSKDKRYFGGRKRQRNNTRQGEAPKNRYRTSNRFVR